LGTPRDELDAAETAHYIYWIPVAPQRLEGLNKAYGTKIIISEQTYEQVKTYVVICAVVTFMD
jgi:hypothetical protein